MSTNEHRERVEEVARRVTRISAGLNQRLADEHGRALHQAEDDDHRARVDDAIEHVTEQLAEINRKLADQ
jgi:tetrahydromethanopterin S-methyltransferase subunit G